MFEVMSNRFVKWNSKNLHTLRTSSYDLNTQTIKIIFKVEFKLDQQSTPKRVPRAIKGW